MSFEISMYWSRESRRKNILPTYNVVSDSTFKNLIQRVVTWIFPSTTNIRNLNHSQIHHPPSYGIIWDWWYTKHSLIKIIIILLKFISVWLSCILYDLSIWCDVTVKWIIRLIALEPIKTKEGVKLLLALLPVNSIWYFIQSYSFHQFIVLFSMRKDVRILLVGEGTWSTWK